MILIITGGECIQQLSCHNPDIPKKTVCDGGDGCNLNAVNSMIKNQ
jgi:hypothetical protein